MRRILENYSCRITHEDLQGQQESLILIRVDAGVKIVCYLALNNIRRRRRGIRSILNNDKRVLENNLSGLKYKDSHEGLKSMATQTQGFRIIKLKCYNIKV